MKARAVILAAGTSSRMGAQKLLMPYRGRRMIDYAIDAARDWQPLVVAGPKVASALGDRRDTEIVVNEAPQRGMAHSLRLADAVVEPDAALIVLLADKPRVTAALVERIWEALSDADVAYPVDEQEGLPGHPVIFSPRVRAKIQGLPDGDTLRELRDDQSFRRAPVPTADAGAFFDVDTPAALGRS